jgi:hypothetical protein
MFSCCYRIVYVFQFLEFWYEDGRDVTQALTLIRRDRSRDPNYDRDEWHRRELEHGGWSFSTTSETTRKKPASCHARIRKQHNRKPTPGEYPTARERSELVDLTAAVAEESPARKYKTR